MFPHDPRVTLMLACFFFHLCALPRALPRDRRRESFRVELGAASHISCELRCHTLLYTHCSVLKRISLSISSFRFLSKKKRKQTQQHIAYRTAPRARLWRFRVLLNSACDVVFCAFGIVSAKKSEWEMRSFPYSQEIMMWRLCERFDVIYDVMKTHILYTTRQQSQINFNQTHEKKVCEREHCCWAGEKKRKVFRCKMTRSFALFCDCSLFELCLAWVTVERNEIWI